MIKSFFICELKNVQSGTQSFKIFSGVPPAGAGGDLKTIEQKELQSSLFLSLIWGVGGCGERKGQFPKILNNSGPIPTETGGHFDFALHPDCNVAIKVNTVCILYTCHLKLYDSG